MNDAVTVQERLHDGFPQGFFGRVSTSGAAPAGPCPTGSVVLAFAGPAPLSDAWDGPLADLLCLDRGPFEHLVLDADAIAALIPADEPQARACALIASVDGRVVEVLARIVREGGELVIIEDLGLEPDHLQATLAQPGLVAALRCREAVVEDLVLAGGAV